MLNWSNYFFGSETRRKPAAPFPPVHASFTTQSAHIHLHPFRLTAVFKMQTAPLFLFYELFLKYYKALAQRIFNT